MRKVPNWDNYNMAIAFQASSRSKDPNTQVGCYIVDARNRPVSMGYNGFAQGEAETPAMWEQPQKYKYVIHAEKNAINHAYSQAVGLFQGFQEKTTNDSSHSLQDREIIAQLLFSNCALYCTHHPCPDCAELIVRSGIKKVFYCYARGEESEESRKIMDEADIAIIKMANPMDKF